MQTAGKAVAIITARGGSKRIPHKNIKEFCGKPILAYSIEAALASGVFDRVMVSTDDEEIAEVARKYGAEVPFLRSEKTANDYATTKDVLEEVLAEYEKRGEHFDTLCCIYPTAPFITPDRLSEAMRLLEEKKGDTLLPVVRFSFPPQRCVVQDAEGYLKFKWPEYRNSRSQDLEPYYHDAGQFYCLRVSSFLAQQNLIMEKTVPMELPETEVQDIPNFQGNAAVNYTDRETPWTRIIEHKWFEFGKDEQGLDLPKTVISREYSSEWKPGDEPYYPVNDEKNGALYAEYKKLADAEQNVIFGGRLAEYRYYDMDAVIASALQKSEEVL